MKREVLRIKKVESYKNKSKNIYKFTNKTMGK